MREGLRVLLSRRPKRDRTRLRDKLDLACGSDAESELVSCRYHCVISRMTLNRRLTLLSQQTPQNPAGPPSQQSANPSIYFKFTRFKNPR